MGTILLQNVEVSLVWNQ